MTSNKGILVVGATAQGLQAALTLAHLGRKVTLTNRNIEIPGPPSSWSDKGKRWNQYLIIQVSYHPLIEVFTETEAVHSTGLLKKGASPICITDDIGRHNALDKVIGYGLLKDVDFSNTFVSSTGRQPSEMILRCGNANIPIIATKGVPTTLAIETAEKVGITIVGLVRGSSMTVYSNPSRIE